MDARTPLLDAAERLFGEHGIAGVSNRRIAEAAHNANHSAVGYHFGGREGLLAALSTRHIDELEAHRAQLFATSTSLRGDIEALVLPSTALFARLPQPSWRARFLLQALTDPSVLANLSDWKQQAPVVREIAESVGRRLGHLDVGVVSARGRMMAHVMAAAYAEIEAYPDATPEIWDRTGVFLCESMVGLLGAPSTQVLPQLLRQASSVS